MLGSYTSAVLLMAVAGYMGFESIRRLLTPAPIRFDEAIPVALLGLAVNVVSAWLLSTGEAGHGHEHGTAHGHGEAARQRHLDLNLRAAYLHVVADAATSVLAVGALLGGRYFGATWLDPVMGLVGAIVIAKWAYGLMRDSAAVLLDTTDEHVAEEIRELLESSGDVTISDLHVWQVGPDARAAIVSVVAAASVSADAIRERLAPVHELSHLTVEHRTA